ncbi:MAG: conjugal transfer protein TraF [Gammaproteobacteria bacterium]|nr:conjugal transfer protein TraF [Gammaproteobacteria bacterium]
MSKLITYFCFILISQSLWALSDDSLTSYKDSYGFFYFYSAACPHCQHFAPVLKRYSDLRGFAVIAISMDGGYLYEFPNAKVDQGQSRVFAVKTLPALFLVSPKENKAIKVCEGAIDLGELSRRVKKVFDTKGDEV